MRAGGKRLSGIAIAPELAGPHIGDRMHVNRNLNNNRGLDAALKAAVAASQEVGALMRRNQHVPKRANEVTQHDIKLELDVRSQKLIERRLHAVFPEVSLLGEEGDAGEATSEYRWVVDPIDGTVNFAYGIPHACVSIALQGKAKRRTASTYADGYDTLVGVVYDPFCNELWTAVRGGPTKLNGRVTRASSRAKVNEAIVSIGFAKTRKNLEATLPYFVDLVHRVRKIRIMGAAALALTYVASGRFDAYIERGIRLWDIAAGGLILECAGGVFRREAVDNQHTYRIVATNQGMRWKFRMPTH
jgi:myo-inositol-1(or 4)-monophosphatase